jgi:hypothetical protein
MGFRGSRVQIPPSRFHLALNNNLAGRAHCVGPLASSLTRFRRATGTQGHLVGRVIAARNTLLPGGSSVRTKSNGTQRAYRLVR